MKPENRPVSNMPDVVTPSSDVSYQIAERCAELMPNEAGENDFTRKADELLERKTFPTPD